MPLNPKKAQVGKMGYRPMACCAPKSISSQLSEHTEGSQTSV